LISKLVTNISYQNFELICKLVTNISYQGFDYQNNWFINWSLTLSNKVLPTKIIGLYLGNWSITYLLLLKLVIM